MGWSRTGLLLALAVTLAGCDRLMPDESIQRNADGKATGAACRHAGRAIEDCYTLNSDAPRAAVFEGWKEMNDYMRENKIGEVKPTEKPAVHAAEAHPDAAGESAHTAGETIEEPAAAAEAHAETSKHEG